MGSSTLAKVGDQEVADSEMSEAMQRRLQQVAPAEARTPIMRAIIGDFDAILDALIDQRTLIAFADKFGFPLSKRLVDAEIAQIPQTKGLNGKFSEQAYQAFLAQQRLTDAEVRQILAGGLAAAAAADAGRHQCARVGRHGDALCVDAARIARGRGGAIPLEPFKAGLKPTDAQLQQFYAANRNRYMVPEQRALRFATDRPGAGRERHRIGPGNRGLLQREQGDLRAKETRNLSQAVVQDQATANAIAATRQGRRDARRRGGARGRQCRGDLAQRTRPAQAYAGVAGDKAAGAVFAAPPGAVVGPVQSDFGWVVVKVDSVKTEGGKSLDQARAEIAAKLTADKRKAAIEDMVDKVQDARRRRQQLHRGGGEGEVAGDDHAADHRRRHVARGPGLQAAAGTRARAQDRLRHRAQRPAGDRRAAERRRVMRWSRPAQVVPAAPAPLASIRDRVASDWINDQALERAARRRSRRSQRRSSAGRSLADAMKDSRRGPPAGAAAVGAADPDRDGAEARSRRRCKMLFTLGQGKSRMVARPAGPRLLHRQGQQDHARQRAAAAGADRPDAAELSRACRRIMRSNSWPRCAPK